MSHTTIRALYGTLIATTLQLDKALSGKLSKAGFLPNTLIAELAEEHALQYGCHYAVADNGGYRFYTCEEATSANRHEAAQKQWNRCIAKYHEVKRDARGGSRNKSEPKVTPRKTKRVSELLAAFNDLTAAERAAFLADAK